MSRIEDIVEVDRLYNEVTDETDMAAWQKEIIEKFYPRAMKRQYRK